MAHMQPLAAAAYAVACEYAVIVPLNYYALRGLLNL